MHNALTRLSAGSAESRPMSTPGTSPGSGYGRRVGGPKSAPGSSRSAASESNSTRRVRGGRVHTRRNRSRKAKTPAGSSAGPVKPDRAEKTNQGQTHWVYIRETASRDPCISLKKTHQILSHCQHDTVHIPHKVNDTQFCYIRHLICDHCKPLYCSGVEQVIGSAVHTRTTNRLLTMARKRGKEG